MRSSLHEDKTQASLKSEGDNQVVKYEVFVCARLFSHFHLSPKLKYVMVYNKQEVFHDEFDKNTSCYSTRFT